VGVLAVSGCATHGSRTACGDLFEKLDDEIGTLVADLQIAREGLRDLASAWPSEAAVTEIVALRNGAGGRHALQEALHGVTRTLALLRGTMAAAALDEGTSYAQLEELTGLRRQTWADLVAKARIALRHA